MPASRMACSAAPSAKRCERLANLSSLRSAAERTSAETLDLGRDARRKAARIEQRDRRAPLRPASSASQVVATSLPTGVTRPTPVMATRRDRPFMRGPWPRTSAELDAVATACFADVARSARSLHGAVVLPPVASTPSSDLLSRRRERAHLDVGHASTAPSVLLPPSGDSLRERRRQPHLRVEHQRRREHRTPRKVIAERTARARAPCNVARIDCAGTCIDDDRLPADRPR